MPVEIHITLPTERGTWVEIRATEGPLEERLEALRALGSAIVSLTTAMLACGDEEPAEGEGE